VRTFTDATGRRWDVIAGRESWGAIFALFVPRKESGGIRQTPLRATSHDEARSELEALDENGLRRLFEISEPKTL
jgi:hypothetical protein